MNIYIYIFTYIYIYICRSVYPYPHPPRPMPGVGRGMGWEGGIFEAIINQMPALKYLVTLESIRWVGYGGRPQVTSHIACAGILGEVGANRTAYAGVRGVGAMSNIREKIVGAQIWLNITAPQAFV